MQWIIMVSFNYDIFVLIYLILVIRNYFNLTIYVYTRFRTRYNYKKKSQMKSQYYHLKTFENS